MKRKTFANPESLQNPFYRKFLCPDALFSVIRNSFLDISYPRGNNTTFSLQDVAMSAFAMFSLKDASLLQFDERRKSAAGNLRNLYGIQSVPSDTQLRSLLDPVSPSAFRRSFTEIFALLQRGKVLESRAFLDGHYLVSGDGSGFFYSEALSNDQCQVKRRNSNKKTGYYQSFYAACLVHPDFSTVIPFAPEFMVQQDGSSKNDCERNASKRFLEDFRREHPHLKVIFIEDGLSSNGPHIQELKRHNMRFILGAKENDHQYLFEQSYELENLGQGTRLQYKDEKNPSKSHDFFFANGLALNKSNRDLKVNFIDYWETSYDKHGNKQKELHFSWVTDLEITQENVYQIMRGGRARWKIENETFNTLKNQGYHLGHNYGLGKQNLSLNFVTLTFLAFFVDQVLLITSEIYQAAYEKTKAKYVLFERIRGLFYGWEVDSMATILEAICYGIAKKNLAEVVEKPEPRPKKKPKEK